VGEEQPGPTTFEVFEVGGKKSPRQSREESTLQGEKVAWGDLGGEAAARVGKNRAQPRPANRHPQTVVEPPRLERASRQPKGPGTVQGERGSSGSERKRNKGIEVGIWKEGQDEDGVRRDPRGGYKRERQEKT